MNAFDLAEMKAVLREREPGYAVIATDAQSHWWSYFVHDRGRFVAAFTLLDDGVANMAFIWKEGNKGYNVRVRMPPAEALRLALDLRNGQRAIESIDGMPGVIARHGIMRGTPNISPALWPPDMRLIVDPRVDIKVKVE